MAGHCTAGWEYSQARYGGSRAPEFLSDVVDGAKSVAHEASI
jgi:hypothetical protein